MPDARIGGRPLDAVVVAEIGGVAVAVVFLVGLVVPLVIADQIGQGEAVVAGDVVDRRPRPPAVVLEQVAGGQQVGGQFGQHPIVAPPEPAHGIAKAVVPFGGAGGKAAELVAAGTDVPRLGDDLDLGQGRVLADRVEEPAPAIVAILLAAERDRQIEAEAVDMDLIHPIAQAVHHHLQHAGMGQIQRVAATGIVDVVAAVVRTESVVGGVVDSAKTQRRPHLIAFGGMVVDHVQQDFDAGVVQALDHGFELGQIAAAEVARFRREEAQGAVAPVVAQAAIEQKPVVHEGVNRHQFHGGDAERLQVFDDFGMGETGEGAAQVMGYALMADGEAANVGFIDQGSRPGRFGRMVAFPVEMGVHHHALEHFAGVVASIEG